MDPFGRDEIERSAEFAKQWGLYCEAWKRETQFLPFPIAYSGTTRSHELQRDGSTCGIHTLTMCKRYLSGHSLCGYDVGVEGAVIASEILANAQSRRHTCSKCGYSIAETLYRECRGSCSPHKVFHHRCLNPKERVMMPFLCQICDPKRLETFCQMCSRRPKDALDRVKCENGCEMFVHPACLPKGRTFWRCGVCNVR